MSDLSRLEAAIPALRRYAWSLLRNGPEADDLVQDCLVRALDRMAGWQGADMRPWLFTIMHNLHVSRWRRLRRFSLTAVDDADPAFQVGPEQPHRAELRRVVEAMDALPKELREVLLLVAVEGLQYDEAAGVLGLPIGTVMSRLSRARDRLRREVDQAARPALRRVK
jgi:RNA polymerase sigma-70 factor (ECF subfamily)